jgi:hypothetical protein
MARPRTWWLVAGGCLVAGVLAVVAVVGAGAWFFARHVDIRDAPAASAEAEFDEVKRRFEGQAPLIDPNAEGREKIAELERRRATYSGPLPEQFKLLVWDKREKRLVRLSFPFWMLRLQSDESVRINVDGFDLDTLGLDKEDLRLAGPALVLSIEDGGSRVLVWTE